jgi:hypothetical protein
VAVLQARTLLSDVLSWIFMVEMGLKLLGLGCTGYWADPEVGGWNTLDGTLVLLSLLEMIMKTFFGGAISEDHPLSSMLRMLRMLRILRFVRVMKRWKAMRKLAVSFIKAVPQARHAPERSPSARCQRLPACVLADALFMRHPNLLLLAVGLAGGQSRAPCLRTHVHLCDRRVSTCACREPHHFVPAAEHAPSGELMSVLSVPVGDTLSLT